MPVNDAVGQTLRNLYAAVERRDAHGTLATVEDIWNADAVAVLDRAERILTAALRFFFGSRRPSAADIWQLAVEVHAQSAWIGDLPTVAEFDAVLRRVNRPAATVPVAAGDAFLVTAFTTVHLLVHMPGGRPWQDVLDILEDLMEGSG
jgi:hypothetical protein